MTVPHRAMFDDWFSFDRHQPAKEFFTDFLKPFNGIQQSENGWTESHDELAEAVSKADDAYEKLNWKIDASPLWKWAIAQPGFARASKYIDAKRRKKIERISKHWANVALDGSDEEFAALERGFSRSASQLWVGKIFVALHEFYFTDNASRMYELVQRGPNLHRSICRDLAALLALHRQLPTSIGNNYRIRNLERAYEAAEDLTLINAFPITRNAQHKAEQLFVYRMWEANLRQTGLAKPEVIAELMTLEGFDRQFDVRTIERMCAKFKEAKSAIKNPKSAVAKKLGNLRESAPT